MAVIKSKPPGRSAGEHAQALARVLKSHDEGWRKKAQELQQEVLRLRQELLMSRARSNMEAAGRIQCPLTVTSAALSALQHHKQDFPADDFLQPSISIFIL